MRRVSDEAIERVAAFLPVFEANASELVGVDPDGTMFSGYLYGKPVEDLINALYAEGFVLSFDWMTWQSVAERYVLDATLLERAPVTVLQRLLTTHVRRDRFHDGHLATMTDNGHISAILRRLARIAERRRMRRGTRSS